MTTRGFLWFLLGVAIALALGLSSAMAADCAIDSGSGVYTLDTNYTASTCPSTEFVVTDSPSYQALTDGQGSTCSSGDTACLQLAFSHSVWDQPASADYASAWAVGFVFPVALFLIAWGAGRVLEFIK